MNNVAPQANGDSSKVKVKVRVNINGLFNVSSATITEKVENPTPAADEQESQPMEVDEGKSSEPAADAEARENQKQEEGSGDSPRESSSVNSNIADVEPDNKDGADKVQI